MQVFKFNHPLIDSNLTTLRDKKTNSATFRLAAKRISILMGSELLSDLKTSEQSITTPLAEFVGHKIAEPFPLLVSILRAGNIMVENLLEICPEASVGYIGLYRDHETLEPQEYFNSLDEDLSERQVILCDPMLATGGSAVYAVNLIKKCNPASIRFACILAAEYGIEQLNTEHSDVPIFAASIDKHLDDNGYIIPGLGDAGDRIFGTASD